MLTELEAATRIKLIVFQGFRGARANEASILFFKERNSPLTTVQCKIYDVRPVLRA